jgi:hypothetical protein
MTELSIETRKIAPARKSPVPEDQALRAKTTPIKSDKIAITRNAESKIPSHGRPVQRAIMRIQ